MNELKMFFVKNPALLVLYFSARALLLNGQWHLMNLTMRFNNVGRAAQSNEACRRFI